MTPGKIVANRGVPRNKKPLQNILYLFGRNRDGSKWLMQWAYEQDFNKYGVWNFHGSVTEEEIRARLTQKQWSNFRQGERYFVRQRRVDGHNIKKS